jgi:hypothetical protein
MGDLDQPEMGAFNDRAFDEAAPNAVLDQLIPGYDQIAVFLSGVGDVFHFQTIKQAHQMD